jgi:3-oxoacyl-[acyl-carrier protein] reductase
MMFELTGKVMIVTGAGRGIGRAIALCAAAAGADLVLGSRTKSELEAVAAEASPHGRRIVCLPLDLCERGSIDGFARRALAAFGRIDVLVNNAALYVEEPVGGSRRIGHPLAETPYDEWVAAWRKTLAVNLEGAAHLTWCVARQMLDVAPADGVKRGAIVNVGSRGAYRGEPDVPAYGAAKAGLHALGQSLAVSLAPHDITVTSIAPGFIATDMTAQLLAGPGGDAIRAQSPYGRVATAEEVADAIVWLASPAATWSTGAVLDFNGASYLR